MATAREILLIVRLQNDATRGLHSLARELENVGGVVGTVAKVAVAAAAALGGLVVGIGTIGINFLRMREQAEVGLGFVIKNAQLAKSMVAELIDFAQQNPIPVGGLIEAARFMAGVGVEASKIIPTLKAVADATAAVGGGEAIFNRIAYAIQQVIAKGRLQAEEVRQLANAGIPALAILADKTGMTQAEILKAMRTGSLAANSVELLLEGIRERFAGALAAQGETLNGLITRVRNYAQTWAATAAEPAFEVIKGHLRDVIALMESPAFKQSAAIVGASVGAVLALPGQVLGAAGRGLGALGAPAPGTAFGGGEGEDAGNAPGRINEVQTALSGVQAALAQLFGYIQTYVFPVLADLGSRFAKWIREDALPWLRTLRDAVAETFVTHVLPLIQTAVEAIGRELERLGPWIDNTFIPAMRVFINQTVVMIDTFIRAWQFLWPRIEPYVMLVLRQVGRIIRQIQDVVDLTMNLLAGNWERAWDALQRIAVRSMEGTYDSIRTILNKIIDAMNLFSWFPDIPKIPELPRSTGTSVSRIFGGGEGEDAGGNGSQGFLQDLLARSSVATEQVVTNLEQLSPDLMDFDAAVTDAASGARSVADKHAEYLKLVEETAQLHLKSTARVAEETMQIAERLAEAKMKIQNFFLGELQAMANRGVRFGNDAAFGTWAAAAGLQPIGNFPAYQDGQQVNPAFDQNGNPVVTVQLGPDLVLDGVQ